MKVSKVSIAVAAYIALVANNAMADYIRVDATSASPTPMMQEAQRPVHQPAMVQPVRNVAPNQSFGNMTQIGSGTGSFPVIDGKGKTMPFKTALQRVVPSGWSSKSVGSFNADKNVVMPSEGNWTYHLAKYAEQTQTNITINWDTKTVTVQGYIAPPHIMTGSNGSIVNGVPVKPANPKEAKWDLQSSKSLRDNIEVWAKTAGYTLVWEASDYDLENGVVITNDFNGAIANVMEMFKNKPIPLRASFYGNKVLQITDNRNKQVQN